MLDCDQSQEATVVSIGYTSHVEGENLMFSHAHVTNIDDENITSELSYNAKAMSLGESSFRKQLDFVSGPGSVSLDTNKDFDYKGGGLSSSSEAISSSQYMTTFEKMMDAYEEKAGTRYETIFSKGSVASQLHVDMSIGEEETPVTISYQAISAGDPDVEGSQAEGISSRVAHMLFKQNATEKQIRETEWYGPDEHNLTYLFDFKSRHGIDFIDFTGDEDENTN